MNFHHLTSGDKTLIGRGVSTDIRASVKAYLDGINKILKCAKLF